MNGNTPLSQPRVRTTGTLLRWAPFAVMALAALLVLCVLSGSATAFPETDAPTAAGLDAMEAGAAEGTVEDAGDDKGEASGEQAPSYSVTVADYEGPEGIRPGPRAGGRPLQLYRNKNVESLIGFYLNKRRDVVERGYKRSWRYLPMIRRILAEEGVPPELAYLAAVESNFNPRARSRARAVGLWQFTRPTARKFGLRMHSPWYDERMDPEASTVAAARLLAYLYDRFENWELALAAYNAGEKRVFDAMDAAKRRGGRTDFWALRLPRETQGFIPSFLALASIWEHSEEFGLDSLPQDAPLDTESVEVNLSGTLKELSNRLEVPLEVLAEMNPGWKGKLIPPFDLGPVVLHVPQGKGALLASSLNHAPLRPIQWLVHRIREGDTVSAMAAMYGVRVGEILSLNGLGRRSILRIGRPMLVPVAQDHPTAASRTAGLIARKGSPQESDVPVLSQLHFHTVQDGESFWSISRRYGVRMADLRRWNLSPMFRGMLQPHQQLVVFRP